MKIDNIKVYNFENAIRGMRNPKNSWDKSDSIYGLEINQQDAILARTNNQPFEIINQDNELCEFASLGPNDLKLATTLIGAGSEHRKFMRQIFVSMDIEAPLYWWKEMDQYKVGTTTDSCSTMHKLTSQPITITSFEIDDYNYRLQLPHENTYVYEYEKVVIDMLEKLRQAYIETGNQNYWKELIRWLPESWLQKRTWTGSYENIRSIYQQRKTHKLTEWRTVCDTIKTLPYAKQFII